MLERLLRVLGASILLTMLGIAQGHAADADLVIVNARIFDGVHEKLREDAAVVVVQQKIVAVVDSNAAPAARERIDAGGRVLVPTGIALALPRGFAGFVLPRSGLAL